MRVELDVPRPPWPWLFEEAFGCPVGFGAGSIGIVMGRTRLASTGPRTRPGSIVTIEDVTRARRGGAPADRFGVITEQVRLQVLAGTISLEGAARALDTSTRSLQREIAAAGTDFRSLAGRIRLERAIELLRQPEVPITAAATELGYAAPAHFARAFRKATGQAPRAFRRSVLACRVAAE